MAFDQTAPGQTEAEVPLGAAEVFYSRTDPRGVIRSGNAVFRRVSGFSWEQMIGAPHRIVRHPSMPKGVFRLLWDRIGAGRITGAYVKNRARDGGFYWVFAVVSPLPDGFLSVRIKPTGPLLRTLSAEYAALRAAEMQGLDPGASAASLVARLAALGHADYDAFMATALAAELSAPARAALRPPSPRLGQVAAIGGMVEQVLEQKQLLLRLLDDIRAIPMNLHIAAARIETYGGPVATLAENYRLMVGDIAQRLEAVVGTGRGDGLGERMRAAASDALLRIGVEQVQDEAAAQAGPDPAAGFDRGAEAAILQDLARRHADDAVTALAGLEREAARLSAWSEELRRLLLGLDSIRVLCRVEAGRLQLKGSSLDSIIGQLDGFHSGMNGRLERIVDLAAQIRRRAESAGRMAG